MVSLALVLLAGMFNSNGPTYFEVSARFEPPARGQAQGAVLVTFLQTDAGVHINETPAPRFELDAAQTVLDYKAPAKVAALPADPAQAKKLDLNQPVRFPVTLRATAPKGVQSVNATVVYFYCSDHEGWCRRGNEEVAIPVAVP
jgi:hypothetical protein